ncbi:SusC/RagA family TonB-linked outer membrane protein [Segetibacter aerophilus]|uniref:SusC/RagA family TonB-linked outer membrane protein n=1 Tax=Segetibacter aerophilus TaxID=670293 RepID=UPI0011BECDF7|nr:TonB-dependent receptor [Segetibacter aerophilus]
MSRKLTQDYFWSRHLSILILFIFCSTAILAQNVVTGRVVDSANEGVSRVSVIVKGTKRGVVTDAAGNFRINATINDVLVISALGYGTQEISVRGAGPVDVTLARQTAQLTEVVVIGYGQKSRKLLTESISTVGAKDLQKLPVASADAAMQGRVSGVQITNADGSPGSPVAVRVRGVGTVGNTQPLFVIDGIPVGNTGGTNTNPLATLNPNDIENISVLKDASSAAIYGMRAANGVVLITTKRGKSGKPRVSFDAYYGIQQFPKKLRANNTQQYIALAQEALDNRNKQDNLTPGQSGYQVLHPDLIAGTPNSVTGINTDWQEATINKNAPVVNYNVGVSGGTENANYFLSVGYFKQEAVTKNWNLGRYSVRANSDYKVGSRFKIGQTLALSFQEVKRGMNGGGDGFLYANNLSMPPFFKIYDDQNRIPGNRYGYNGNSNVAGFTIGNQLALNEIVKNTDNNYRLLGGLYAELELLTGLKYRSAASIDLGFGRNTTWQPGFTDKEIGYGREVNNYSDNRSQGYTQVFTNTLNYERNIGENAFNLIGGIEYQKIRGNNLSYMGVNFQSTDPAFYQRVSNGRGNNGQFDPPGSGLYNEAYASYFGRLSYNYKEKYLLTATVRRDGTSRFAPEKRFGTFPAVSAAWRISEEDFFKKGIISDLKLRGSWGRLGNANTSSFAYISRVRFEPQYPLNNVPAQAPTPASLPNAEIGWETVESTDFGFDASLFNNKINFLTTYYKRNTIDFLYGLPVPFTSGFSGTDVNVGKVENKGFEFEIGYNTRIAKDLNFNISANLTTVKNKLVSLAPGVEEYSSGNYRTAVGYPIGYFYGYKALGIYQNAAQASSALPDEVAGTSNKPRPGDIIFQDNNAPLPGTPNGKQFKDSADGRITPADRTFLGKTIPDFFYGVNLSANYKGFDLAVLFQGVSGIQVYNQLRQNMEGLGGPGRNQLATTENRWKGEGTSNTMPRAIAGDPYNNNRFSSRWVENAGFFRLKNIQIGYSLPEGFLSKTKAFRSARIYVGGTNLFTITKYTGLDPEVITFGNVSTQTNAGTDVGSTPQPRTFQAGLNFNF